MIGRLDTLDALSRIEALLIFPRVDQRNDVAHVHELVSETRCQRWRHAMRLVRSDPIVPNEVERERVAVVLEFLSVARRSSLKCVHLPGCH